MLNKHGRVVTSDGTSFIGIAGYTHMGCCSIATASLKIPVVLKDGVTVVVGAPAYVDASGLISDKGDLQIGIFVGRSKDYNVDSKSNKIKSSAAIAVNFAKTPGAAGGGVTESQVDTKVEAAKAEVKQTTDKLQTDLDANTAEDKKVEARVTALEGKVTKTK